MPQVPRFKSDGAKSAESKVLDPPARMVTGPTVLEALRLPIFMCRVVVTLAMMMARFGSGLAMVIESCTFCVPPALASPAMALVEIVGDAVGVMVHCSEESVRPDSPATLPTSDVSYRAVPVTDRSFSSTDRSNQ